MVGSDMAIVDKMPRHLERPVDIYNGALVVPYQFKAEIFDALFKKPVVSYEKTAGLSRIKRIILDAGHGGNDPGAISPDGLKEKGLTLDIAKRLGRQLRLEGIDVVYTRSSDKYLSLAERVDIANSSSADLFVSIHINASRSRYLNGIEVYYVSFSADDSERALATAKEYNLNFDPSCFASDSLDLKVILWEMIYSNNRAKSIELAGDICQKIKDALDVKILGIKSARFAVLKGAHMPAVLVEVGFLSNYNEERLLRNGYYRQQLAEAIAAGIHNYSRNFPVMEASKR
jgi:N-acetylmuramoyl-L-alanine amidase